MSARQLRKKVGWTKSFGLTKREAIDQWPEYLKLLWHSYRYGIPKEVLEARERGHL
ncbi:hypothetical protein CALCODRAFT_497399 [Calocera cornea HHB12733]|uniref:Uncharacterized protein n=1 Tax=Calocera cornea HHB12733 TaxID=1353952 RepID=A0A165FB21_9BASI|nr:hypothetical protein CALCODRAFT_497399 [Calocera cornea HHB12733]